MRKIFLAVFLGILIQTTISLSTIKWCTENMGAQGKCLEIVKRLARANLNTQYKLECVQGREVFDCMRRIHSKNATESADFGVFDVGLGSIAANMYGLKPFAMEKYAAAETNLQRQTYYSAILVPRTSDITPFNWAGRQACFSGVGEAAGWLFPLSKMIGELKTLPITQCNNVVLSVGDLLSKFCAPNSLEAPFNVFGENPQRSCSLCGAAAQASPDADAARNCNSRDKYAGGVGAVMCLHEGRTGAAAARPNSGVKPEAAVVRFDAVMQAIRDGLIAASDYELLCPTRQPGNNNAYRIPLTNTSDAAVASCNWGEVQARILMTDIEKNFDQIRVYQNFLRTLIARFPYLPPSAFTPPAAAANSTTNTPFSLFHSDVAYIDNLQLEYKLPTLYPNAYDQLFSDETRDLHFPTAADAITNYLSYASAGLRAAIDTMATCPVSGVRWCCISRLELAKCSRIKSVLDAKRIRPQFECLNGGSTERCVRLISQGYADLMTLEAGHLYSAGKEFGLVPIASEFYGDASHYYAVAVVKRRDTTLLISNMKNRRTCHSGAGSATGWIIPVNNVLETTQIRVFNGQLSHALGELFSRSCIPGILNRNFNPRMENPLNLCEICAGGNADKCQPDQRELYFGDTGAFRCLIESGDVAFTRSYTVFDNTGGRNRNFWARDLRSADYELLCSDGSRAPAHAFHDCNLGRIPGQTVVTAGFKTRKQRDDLWSVLRYTQEYFSTAATGTTSTVGGAVQAGGDVASGDASGATYEDSQYNLFRSGWGETDLMFSDSAVSLLAIPFEQQTYTSWLGEEFLRKVENLESISKPDWSGLMNRAVPTSPSLSCVPLWFLLATPIFLRLFDI